MKKKYANKNPLQKKHVHFIISNIIKKKKNQILNKTKITSFYAEQLNGQCDCPVCKSRV